MVDSYQQKEPIMDENEQQVPAIANRNEAFGAGLVGGQVQAPPSLQAEAARYNASVPQEYRPSGSLNGMSQEQYQATLGGAFANPNGSAMDTWSTKKYFQAPPE
jgi:hypothetical protein